MIFTKPWKCGWSIPDLWELFVSILFPYDVALTSVVLRMALRGDMAYLPLAVNLIDYDTMQYCLLDSYVVCNVIAHFQATDQRSEFFTLALGKDARDQR